MFPLLLFFFSSFLPFFLFSLFFCSYACYLFDGADCGGPGSREDSGLGPSTLTVALSMVVPAFPVPAV